jgi:site-specific DNA recombinase
MGLRQATPHPEVLLTSSQHARHQRRVQVHLAATRQREDCVALCKQRGWEWTEYTDNDRSASNGQPRPAYVRLLADIRAGLIDAVVVWDLDRLHRRPAELEEFIDLANERRLALATVGGETDLSSDGGRLFARIKGAVAKAEVERKSARQKRANQQRRAAGAWLSTGNRTFGYARDGQPLEPEASMVRQAATDVLAGRSLRSIAIAWNQLGVTTTRGNHWTNLALRRVLINPLIAGLVAHKGNVVGRGDWEPQSMRTPGAAWWRS